jgi:hypothetical protein
VSVKDYLRSYQPGFMSHGGDGRAVLLPLHMREFDLLEVMDTAGDGTHLRWVLRDAWFNGDVRAVWPTGHEYAESESWKPGGLRMTWAEMRRLAETCNQIVDARFTGYDESGEPHWQFLVEDSTFWVVWSRDPAGIEPVRLNFPDAEDHDAPVPERLASGG